MPCSTHASPSRYLDSLRAVASKIDPHAVEAYVASLHDAWREGRQVLVFGNGGSAATASHSVADLVKTAAVDGLPRLRALCLSDNAALLTAIGNDMSYGESFLYALQAYAGPGDLVVAISASGSSQNVVRACEWARSKGLRVVAMTGFGGGRLAELCDVHIHVPSDNYGIVEDLHMSVGHMAAQALQSRLFAESAAA